MKTTHDEATLAFKKALQEAPGLLILPEEHVSSIWRHGYTTGFMAGMQWLRDKFNEHLETK